MLRCNFYPVNVGLNDQDAYEKGTKLLRLVQIVYKPLTKAEYDILEERREKIK